MGISGQGSGSIKAKRKEEDSIFPTESRIEILLLVAILLCHLGGLAIGSPSAAPILGFGSTKLAGVSRRATVHTSECECEPEKRHHLQPCEAGKGISMLSHSPYVSGGGLTTITT